MKVALVALSVPKIEGIVTAEDLMVYAARVSSPQNQMNTETGAKLLKYCATHNHWSVFEMADMTVEIETSRAIAQQILRHKSFNFQEYSQRYSQVTSFETYEARSQDMKNRQNSVDNMSDIDRLWFKNAQESVHQYSTRLYEDALSKGIAKEQARFLLPSSVTTKLYMKGSVRSWIHFLNVRTYPSTQKEHRDVANAIKNIFCQEFPITSEAMGWSATNV
jgi:thymidylate synthase (FAD)